MDELAQTKTGMGARLRQYFFTGIIVTAPITITIMVTLWLLKVIDSTVAGFIPPQYNPNHLLPFQLPGLGLVVSAVFFVVVGWFARNYFGSLIIKWSEYIVVRMPVVNTIYNTVKQVFETTMGANSQAFREVVLFEYPRKDCWTVGFVTGTTKGEIQSVTDSEVVNVYVPTTPNPTSGFLLFVPRSSVVPLSMTVDDGLKMVISGGIITPKNSHPERK